MTRDLIQKIATLPSYVASRSITKSITDMLRSIARQQSLPNARSNDTRMRAIGFPTYRYKLVCFVIAGTLCGLAGR